jgi:hypothetical protein
MVIADRPVGEITPIEWARMLGRTILLTRTKGLGAKASTTYSLGAPAIPPYADAPRFTRWGRMSNRS